MKEITNAGRGSDQDNDQAPDQDETPVGWLLSAIGEDTLSASPLMERPGLFHRPNFRGNYLNHALECDLIERTIPDRSNGKNQKYRKRGGTSD